VRIALALAVFLGAAHLACADEIPLRDSSEQFDVLLVQQPIEVTVISALPQPHAAMNFAELIAPPPPAPPVRIAHAKPRRHHHHRHAQVRTVITAQRTIAPPLVPQHHLLPHRMHVVAEMALFTPQQTRGFTLLLFGLIALALTPRPAVRPATESP